MYVRIPLSPLQTIQRFIARSFAALALLAVVVLSAFGALRLSIHGREVTVPDLRGKSDADAAAIASQMGLHLSVENRFYSGAVATNHVLSQLPAAGAIVRRGLQVRVTESLGSQQIPVPDVTGQNPRSAELLLKRSQLELGATASLPAPGPAGTILAQTPPPNSTGLNGPHVSLLVSGDFSPADVPAYVMPSLLGMTLYAASSRLGTVGLHVASAVEPDLMPKADPVAVAAAPDPDAGIVGDAAQDPAIPPTVIPPPPPSPTAVIVSQSPAPGHRVTRTDSIRLTLVRAPDTLPKPDAPVQK